jgi:hypothetical protein
MKCVDCPLKYIRQMGWTFNIRYKEHIHDIRSKNSNSGIRTTCWTQDIHIETYVILWLLQQREGRERIWISWKSITFIESVKTTYIWHIYRHIRDIAQTLHKIAARTHPQSCYKSGIKHAEYSYGLYTRSENSSTNRQDKEHGQRGMCEYKEIN